MGYLALAFAWTALIISIKETEGFWRRVLSITLALSIISFFVGMPIVHYITLAVAVCCIPFLLWRGYGFFNK